MPTEALSAQRLLEEEEREGAEGGKGGRALVFQGCCPLGTKNQV